jgi:threonine synthase
MSLGQIKGMRCLACGRGFPARKALWACPDCGDAGLLELTYDLEDAARTLDRASLERREPWMWRYRELLPLDELAELAHLQIGMTPVYGAPRLADKLGIAGLWLKDEGRSPTRSVFDRAALVCALMARDQGREVVAASGEGAAVTAVACAAAALGLRAAAFASDDALAAAAFGATVFTCRSDSRAAELCGQAAARFAWFDASEGRSPFGIDGLKTAAHEIAEQLIERLPDWVAVPAHPPSLVVATAKGLREMAGLGFIRSAPRLLAVAREGAPQEPAGAVRAASEAMRELGGASVRVEPALAASAARWAAREAAVESSAAGALSLAGLARALDEGQVERSATALVLLTGGASNPQDDAAAPVADLEAVERAARSAGLIA